MLKINPDKTVLIAQEEIRRWRYGQFAQNDILLQNALVDGTDPTPYVERRDWLRDLPQSCVGKPVEELRDLLFSLGIPTDAADG